MLVVNKMNKNIETGNILKKIFEEDWEKLFIIDAINDEQITYGNFFTKIITFKEKLIEHGLKKGDFLCLILDNSVDLAALYLSSLLLGSVAIPIDPQKGDDEIKYILNQFKNKTIIYEQNTVLDFYSSIHLKEFKKHKLNLNGFDKLGIFDDIDFNKLFLISFTSGTSGKQKGVMHSFNNLFQSGTAFRKKFNFGYNNIFLHNLPMTYMAGILNLFVLPLISNSKIIITERSTISNMMNFWKITKKYSVNTFWLVPTMLEILIKLDRGDDGINYAKNNELIVCVGTAPLNLITKENFKQKYGIEVFESYGLSETLFVSTNFPKSIANSSVGKILDKVNINFSYDEILVNVPWMFLGYHNLDEKIFFKNKYYLTGDLGKINDDNFLYITGRKKDLIIKGGINVSPRAIEEIISKSSLFLENTILGFPSKILGEKIICFGVLNETISKTDKKLLNMQIIEKLGSNSNVDEFVFVKEIPKNLNGKVDKPKILVMFSQKINDS
jgi:long-chain acyl-CoA synthetase